MHRLTIHKAMTRYLASRLINAVIVVWAAFTVSFVLLYQLPSDPISIMLMGDSGSGGSVEASAAQRHALAERYGFDLSPPRQYAKLLWRAVHGDFGISMQSGRPVSAEIADALPPTLRLAGLSLAIALLLGVSIALAGCRRPDGGVRVVLLSLPPVAMAVPTFWIALMLLQVFAFRLSWLPGISTTGFTSLILPALTLSVPTSAVIAQTLAKGLDDTLAAPFVRQLRANGIPSRTIYLRHVLHNAAIPTLTVLGLIVGGTFAGAVVTETIFSRAGAGRLLQSAVDVQDLPVVQGLVMLMALAYAFVNLSVDLLYPFLDPRIRRAARHAAQV
jgi:peptide/nickel transport system permease protein